MPKHIHVAQQSNVIESTSSSMMLGNSNSCMVCCGVKKAWGTHFVFDVKVCAPDTGAQKQFDNSDMVVSSGQIQGRLLPLHSEETDQGKECVGP